jgi:type III restriction enzyme
LKLILKPFQETARDDLLAELREARATIARKPQAISLTAPTGSGKTVIMTAGMEGLRVGDANSPGLPDATYLWLSDQPELNTQTMRKILVASTEFGTSDIVVIDQSFDQRVLDPGRVYFLNFQKLGKDKNLVSYGDKRTYTIWDTLRATIAERPDELIVIIDEAHRGMLESPTDRKQAQSIAQKFVRGDAQLPAVPILVGVTATPKRFHDLLADANRTLRPVSVTAASVRDSGLLKDVIRLFYPASKTESELTILRRAMRAFREFTDAWRTYCTEQGIDVVRPIMTVQVEDGREGRLSDTDLEEVWKIVDEELGHPGTEAFAHAFQEGAPARFGNATVRYLAPSEIQDDPNVQVVFFKTSLSTGWDCPRAEVMMSFRTARDATLIAQLVGRMVRTPLARSVPGSDILNTVNLYLPSFDRATVKAVVESLTDPDDDALPPMDVEEGNDLVEVSLDEGLRDCYDALAQIPNYAIPRVRQVSQVHRLMRLTRLLDRADIDDSADDLARETLTTALVRTRKRLLKDDAFKQAVAGLGSVDLMERRHEVLGEESKDEDTPIPAGSEPLTDDDIQHLFEEGGRRLREGLHMDLLRALAAEGVGVRPAKVQIAALSRDARVVAELQDASSATVEKLLKKHAKAIAKQDEESRARFAEIRNLSIEPTELSEWDLPLSYMVRQVDTSFTKHLYVDDKGAYPCDFKSGWETRVLAEEMARSDFVGWFRNLDRKRWSLRVPYQVGAEWRPLYPDFVIFNRDADGDLQVSIVDPHRGDLQDAVPKAVGLARYATRHGDLFARIELVTVAGGVVRRLDLTKNEVRSKVGEATTTQHLELLYQTLGTSN